MNKEQTNYLRMFINVQSTMDQKSALWNSVPVILTVKNQFDELLQRIAKVNERTNPNTEGVTASKERILEGLAEKAVVLSGTLQAYAAFNNDEVLASKVKLTKSDILQTRETNVDGLVKPVITAARENLGNLADFMVTGEMITETETSLDDFNAMIGSPRTIRNQAFAAMDALNELIDAGNGLLKNKLDKLMIRYKSSNPEFYNEYLRARTIVD